MGPIESIKVLALHHDPIVARGVSATLREQPDFELLAGVGAETQAAWSASLRPDVVVADYEQGLALIRQGRSETALRHGTAPSVLIVTQRESEREIRHALEQGARGYLLLSCGLDELVDAVRTVRRGMRHIGALAARRLADSVAFAVLTARETEVLRVLAEGHGNKAIAQQLEIGIGTVKSHLKAIFQKLDATSRTEVAAVAERRGLLMLPTQAHDFCQPRLGGSAARTSLVQTTH